MDTFPDPRSWTWKRSVIEDKSVTYGYKKIQRYRVRDEIAWFFSVFYIMRLTVSRTTHPLRLLLYNIHSYTNQNLHSSPKPSAHSKNNCCSLQKPPLTFAKGPFTTHIKNQSILLEGHLTHTEDHSTHQNLPRSNQRPLRSRRTYRKDPLRYSHDRPPLRTSKAASPHMISPSKVDVH